MFTNKGFSLIELICVATIISVLAISAYPRLTSTAESSLDIAIEVIETDIRLTQINAMTRGAAGSVIFTSGASEYRYDSFGTSWISRSLSDIKRGLTINNDTIFTFNSLGELVGSSSPPVTITVDGFSRTLTLTPYTGKALE